MLYTRLTKISNSALCTALLSFDIRDHVGRPSMNSLCLVLTAPDICYGLLPGCSTRWYASGSEAAFERF